METVSKVVAKCLLPVFFIIWQVMKWVRDTSPKTTLPKRHFAETTLCRMRHFVEILPKFGKNAEKDVIKTISYNVFFS